VVVHDDRIVFERYSDDSGSRALETSFSVAKSLVSAPVGIAIDQGRIGSATDPVTDYTPPGAGRRSLVFVVPRRSSSVG
jgi:CubicO group peptidase (beta-lactamase class C family)